MPTHKRQKPVNFIGLPKDAKFFIEFKMEAQTEAVVADLSELTSAPVTITDFEGSISVPVGLGVFGKVSILIAGNAPKGTVSYLVKNGDEVIRSRKDDLSKLGLRDDDVYICRCSGEPVF